MVPETQLARRQSWAGQRSCLQNLEGRETCFPGAAGGDLPPTPEFLRPQHVLPVFSQFPQLVLTASLNSGSLGQTTSVSTRTIPGMPSTCPPWGLCPPLPLPDILPHPLLSQEHTGTSPEAQAGGLCHTFLEAQVITEWLSSQEKSRKISC